MNPNSRGGRVPELHAAFLKTAVDRLERDPRLVGLAAGGSYVSQSIDEFSDLDLVIAVEPSAYDIVLSERPTIAASLGPLLAAFTGEHVGEPRLLICLYGPPLLHVDLKFTSLADASVRVEDPTILWERDGRFSAAMHARAVQYPEPDLQWIEDRFWTWIHYGAAKIGRGELFETIGFLAFLRDRVLGPLALLAAGARPTGVRKLEIAAPEFVAPMEATIATHDAAACLAAVRAASRLYQRLRAIVATEQLRTNAQAEQATMAYLSEIESRCAG